MQNHNETAFNRYPTVWGIIPEDFKPKRILSFGCSTGEEVITAKAYYPDAEVIGIDKNKVVLNIAKMRFPSFTFTMEMPEGTFDLILCNAVLCNHPKNFKEDHNKYMSFDDFKKSIRLIDSKLNDGGYLMMMNSEYILSDAIGYDPVKRGINFTCAVFDKQGNRTTSKQYALWRK